MRSGPGTIWPTANNLVHRLPRVWQGLPRMGISHTATFGGSLVVVVVGVGGGDGGGGAARRLLYSVGQGRQDGGGQIRPEKMRHV